MRKVLVSRPIGNPSPAADWAMCRLSPWSGSRSGLLPDGSGDPRAVVDFHAFTDITIKQGLTTSFNICTLPALPFNAYMFFPTALNAGDITISGALYDTTGTPTVGGGGFWSFNNSIASSSLVPINPTKASIPSAWSDTPSTDDARSYIYADRARVTSFGWRLLYTGPVSTAQGVITVNSAPLKADPPVYKSVGRIQTYTTTALGGIIDCAASPVRILPTTPRTNALSSGKDNVTARPEANLHGIVRHNEPIYSWRDVYQQGLYLTQTMDGANQLGGTINSFFAGNYPANSVPVVNGGTCVFGTLNMYDQGWDTTTITCTGVTGSYRFETWMCVEFVPAASSAYYDLARVVKEADTKVVDAVGKKAAQGPLATTANGAPSA